MKFNNLRASVPLQAEELSYANNALVRPIVAYMNANRTVIPLSVVFSMELVSSFASRVDNFEF
jgi:hypothetical protein